MFGDISIDCSSHVLVSKSRRVTENLPVTRPCPRFHLCSQSIVCSKHQSRKSLNRTRQKCVGTSQGILTFLWRVYDSKGRKLFRLSRCARCPPGQWARVRIERSGFESWPETLRSALGQDTLPSHSFLLPLLRPPPPHSLHPSLFYNRQKENIFTTFQKIIKVGFRSHKRDFRAPESLRYKILIF